MRDGRPFLLLTVNIKNCPKRSNDSFKKISKVHHLLKTRKVGVHFRLKFTLKGRKKHKQVGKWENGLIKINLVIER